MTNSTRPPLSLHEAAVERLFDRDPRTGEVRADPALTAAVNGLRTGRAAAESLVARVDATLADPRLTRPAALAHMREHVPSHADRIGTRLDEAAGTVARALAQTAAAMALPEPRTPEAVQLAAEMRTLLRNMTPEARRDALAGLDDATTAAVLRAAPALSGLSEAAHALLRDRWQAARHPAEHARARRLTAASEALATAAAATTAMIAQLVSMPGAAAAEAAVAAAADGALAPIRRERSPDRVRGEEAGE